MRRPPTDARCRWKLTVVASLCVLGLPVFAHEIGTTRVTLHAHVTFDGRAVAPSGVSESSGAAASPDAFVPPAATVLLRGRIPPGAQSVAWSYDLTYAPYALTLKSPRTTMDRTEWLEGGQQSTPFALGTTVVAPSRLRIAVTYFSLGFTHILPNGLDHILFVLGIFLFSRRLTHVLWQVSAFTIAHSITLGLTLYGVVSLHERLELPLLESG